MEKEAKIYVAGGQSLIGAAILRELEGQGYGNLLGKYTEGLDLTDPSQVDAYFATTKPEYVFLAAGKSGGIQANQKYPAELMRDNLLTECHILHSAFQHRVKKLLYLASSCSYPKHCPQPMKEEYLLTGLLEPTNEAYALAKIAGIKLCQAYRRQYGAPFLCGIPGNAFGPGDDFSEEDSHVIPGLIRRMHEAKQKGDPSFLIWGTGAPRREFIYSRDLAEACILVLKKYEAVDPINLGMGSDISIAELAGLLKEIIGFKGEISFDPSRPDGMPMKLLDSRKLQALNWKPRTPFKSALAATYQWFLQSEEKQDRGPRPEGRGKNTATGKELMTADRGPSTAEFRPRTADR
jgi:GDP-L-fucose synthase